MKRIAVIACDHGLGHVRRTTLVADALARRGAQVTLLAPQGSVGRVRAALGVDAPGGVVVQDFATRTRPEALRRGDRDAVRWEERLPDLDAFDRVVSDTLPEVIELRPDAVVLAQFLWHDVLEGLDPAFVQRGRGLAERARVVIGSAPFVMPAVRALPGFVEVGLHAAPGTHRRPPAGQDLLVSGGTTPALTDELRTFVADLVPQGPGPYVQVHVDEVLLPDHAPGWLVAASHGADLYDRLAAAVVRPGLGVVTELLARSVELWCVREAENAELAHNAAVLVERGAGHDGASPAEVLARGSRVSGSPEGTALRFDGADVAAELILEG